jgi:hypothetical protein
MSLATPERIQGRKAIAAALGLTEISVWNLAALPVDPMPLWVLGGRVWVFGRYLREWDERRRDLRRIRMGIARSKSRPRPTLPVLAGREAIARKAGVSRRMIDRWAATETDPLPLIGRDERRERLPGGIVWIYDTALRDWIQRHNRPYTERSAELARRGETAGSDELDEPSEKKIGIS